MLKFNKTHCSAAISEAKMLLILLEARKLFIFNTILTCTGADRPACLLYIQCKTVLPHSNIKLFCFPLVLQQQPQWVYAVLHHLRRWRRSKHSSLGQICTAQGLDSSISFCSLHPPKALHCSLSPCPGTFCIGSFIHVQYMLWWLFDTGDWASMTGPARTTCFNPCIILLATRMGRGVTEGHKPFFYIKCQG